MRCRRHTPPSRHHRPDRPGRAAQAGGWLPLVTELGRILSLRLQQVACIHLHCTADSECSGTDNEEERETNGNNDMMVHGGPYVCDPNLALA